MTVSFTSGGPPEKEEAPDLAVEGTPKAFGGADSNTTSESRPAHPKSVRSAPALAQHIVEQVTTSYLADLDPDEPFDPKLIAGELVSLTNAEFRIENVGRALGLAKSATANEKNAITLLQRPTAYQVAMVLIELHRVVRLIASRTKDAKPDDLDPLMIWDAEAGIYHRSEGEISALVVIYAGGEDDRFDKNVLRVLKAKAPRVRRETTSSYAAVANGDYERATGELLPFSPGRVFLTRGPVNYVPDAVNPVIHNDDDGTDWDVDSGLLAIADGDEGTLDQLWQVFASVVQPQVRTNRAVALVNPKGNNGKGTILELARNLAGQTNTLSASVSSLGKDTTLPLVSGKSLIVSDENATNDFVKNAETVKLLATRDPFLVNPKYQQPYNDVFEGTQIHCLNALPRFGDNSASMWRRWLFVPLTAEFEGIERKYVKDDYIQRPEVLEYILSRALSMDFAGYTQTTGSQALMDEAMLHNDPVRRFWVEHQDEFAWDLLPFEFLYELYKGWFLRNQPSGSCAGRSTFNTHLIEVVRSVGGDWEFPGLREAKKAASRMLVAEPLTTEYEVKGRFEMPDKWKGPIDRLKQFRDVLLRDPVKAALTAAAAAATAASPAEIAEAQVDVASVEALAADDLAEWERRAVEDDGVTDADHVAAHAAIRRMGTACACGAGSQRPYPDDVHKASKIIDSAVFAARDRVAELAALPGVG